MEVAHPPDELPNNHAQASENVSTGGHQHYRLHLFWCEKHSHQSRSDCGYLPRLDGLACANADAATDFESLP